MPPRAKSRAATKALPVAECRARPHRQKACQPTANPPCPDAEAAGADRKCSQCGKRSKGAKANGDAAEAKGRNGESAGGKNHSHGVAAADGDPGFDGAANDVKPVTDAHVDERPAEEAGAAAIFVGGLGKMAGVFFRKNCGEISLSLWKCGEDGNEDGQKIEAR